METNSSLDVVTLLIGLSGGLALFLYGMERMTDALKSVAGQGMKSILARLTTNRFNAALAGAFVTAVIQSSSVTTVLVVGFISAGLMSLTQSIGIIMGANVGTTITAQIIAFKITRYALVLVAVGFAMLFTSRREQVRHYGYMLMGLGLIFFGMELMSDATRPLRDYQPFIDLMQRMANPALGILASAAFTGLIQSSSATTGVIIVLASQGFISLEAGIALVFGANIGTCVTALLAAIGKPRAAVQAAAVHVLFNVLGVVLWLGLIDELALAVRWLSPAAGDASGIARMAAETPRQIANAHTIFNVTNTLVFIGLVTPMAKLVQRLVPERRAAASAVIQPRYLDEILLETPSLALDRVRMELRRLGERAHEMVRQALPVAFTGSAEALTTLADRDDEVDVLHGAIITYLGRLSLQNLHRRQSILLHRYMSAANSMESIADLIENNLVEAGRVRLRGQMTVSDSTAEVLTALHKEVCWAIQLALEALDASDVTMAQQVIDLKPTVSRLARDAEHHLARRLVAEGADRLAYFRFESELVEDLKRIYYFAKQIAKQIAPQDPEAAALQDEAAARSGSVAAL